MTETFEQSRHGKKLWLVPLEEKFITCFAMARMDVVVRSEYE